MRDSEKQLKTLFSLCRDPVLGIRDGSVVFANTAATALFEHPLEGKPAADLLPPHLLSASAAEFVASAVVSGQSVTVAATHMDDLLLLRMTPEDTDHSAHMAPPAFMAPLDAAIFNVKMCADLIAKHCGTKKDPKLESYLSLLYHNYFSALRLTNNLHTLSDLQSGSIVFKPKFIDAVPLCAKIIDTVRHLTAERQIQLTFDSQEENILLRSDSRLLSQMLLNLLSNSLLHTSAGGSIQVSLRCSQNLTILVDDTGGGIPPEVMSEVFTRFERKATLSGMADGAGFGLAIAKGIAELHGGAMVIESREGVGTSVRVMLPLDTSCKFLTPETEYDSELLFMSQILTELSPVLNYHTYSEKYLD